MITLLLPCMPEMWARFDELDETFFQSRDPNFACFPNEHAVELVEWQKAKQRDEVEKK